MKHRQGIHRKVATSLLLMSGFLCFVSAQDKALALKEQPAVPAPGKMITITMRMSNNRIATVSQFDKEMIRIEREGQIFGIIPRLLDKWGNASNASVELEFFQIIKTNKDGGIINERVTSIERIELNDNTPQATPVNQISSVQLVSVSDDARAPVVGMSNPTRLFWCCITCGGETTCGACVEVYCGSCCD